ncbi:hypothetical protein SDC9_204474 [bioreactor metagenome]|uniref:Uncharacterized protein n=1 Tax=bioreactor metagenome TaxID=1076179 RepID=A0A645J111_9ZZZZ
MGLDDLVAGGRCEFVEVGLRFVAAVARRLEERAAREIIKPAVYHLKSDFVIVIAARLMRIKRGGGRVVEVHSRDDADLVVHLALE